MIDLGQAGATQSRRKRAVEMALNLLHWPISASLILLGGGLVVAYLEASFLATVPYSGRIGEISGSLLTFNGVVLLARFQVLLDTVTIQNKGKRRDKL